MSRPSDIIESYSARAAELAPVYEAVPSGALLEDALPRMAKREVDRLALDVGAGTGRDAAWLTTLGYEVVAAEPAAGMRTEGGRLHPDAGIRWIDDRLPALERIHGLALSFDLILLSAVWQHVEPDDRARAFRKLATLLRPGGLLVITLRRGPSPPDRPMHETSRQEIEHLCRAHGLEVSSARETPDRQGRSDVGWTTMCLRLPDDGAGALPLVRGIVLSDEKSSTYKLALLRAVARVAEQAPAAATSAVGEDAVELPLGLIALNWLRMYLPLVRAGLPQMPRNSGTERLAFAKADFSVLLERRIAASDLRVGATFNDELAVALAGAMTRAVAVISDMPANFTRYPNSDARVFSVVRSRRRGAATITMDLRTLGSWGALRVPGHLWRALTRYGSWIEPMLVSEWARLSRGYAERMGFEVAPGVAEAALAWAEPVRSTTLGRLAAQRLIDTEGGLACVWTGRRLTAANVDLDHNLPWSAWPCGDLWNLVPCHDRTNRHEKRDRLPSAAALTAARERMQSWWARGYLADAALASRFGVEVQAALPITDPNDVASVFEGVDWRRLRLRQEQQLPEWTPTS